MKTTIKNLEKSEIEIIGSLPTLEFEKYEDKAISSIAERLEIPGFRKGKVPTTIVKDHVSEMMILEEMAERALHDVYPKILEENKIDAIGRPQISITKIAKGVDLEFKIITAIIPEMKLPDYKSLANAQNKKDDFKKEIVVDETEVEKTILQLRKMRAEQAIPKHEHEDGEAHEHTTAEITEADYPAFDDEFAKSFGDFENAEAFKSKIRSNMKIEKETEQKDKLRLTIIEELLEKTEGEIPEILIESETDKIMYRLEADVANMGFKFEEYLTQINKTVDDLRKEWRSDALKRAKLQVVIHTISEKENIKPSEEEIDIEINKIVTMYKDADPIRARAYVENMLENEKVFLFLESQ